MNKGRTRVLGTLLAALALPAAGALAQDGIPVRIGAVPISGHLDVYTAETLGYFDEEGLDVEIVQVRSGAEAQAAVIAGDLNFIGVNGISMIFGLHEGFEFVVGADGFRAPNEPPGTSAIVVRADGGIDEPADLEGQRLGIVTRRGLHELYLVMWAEENDVDLSTITFIEVGYGQMIDALVAEQVDAVIPLEPIITAGVQSGRVEVLSFYDTEVDPGHANGLWVGMRDWAEENTDAMNGFQNAVNRAHTYLNENPEERARLTVEWTNQSPELVAAAAEDEFTTELPIESVQWQADRMHELGWIENEVDVSGAFWVQ
ncbi:MAG: ABC transporter substrate-binding protein [Azospirillaceae bacterium]